jgi:2-dehydropantoate 2-reductase
VRALARALDAAGLPAHLELGVHETNPATTVCAIGVGMSLAIAGSFDALADDEALADLASRACREGVAIARTIGRPLAGATLAPWLASGWSLRAARALLGRFSPEALFYAEEHFGRKLRAQHVAMAREIVELARARGLGHAAFDELAARLAAVGAEARNARRAAP